VKCSEVKTVGLFHRVVVVVMKRSEIPQIEI